LKEALEWYKYSAEQGYAHSQYRTGLFYEEGKGTEVNLIEAYQWYRQAAEQGHELSIEKVKALEKLFNNNRLKDSNTSQKKSFFGKLFNKR
jgi:TPR repeat protein